MSAGTKLKSSGMKKRISKPRNAQAVAVVEPERGGHRRQPVEGIGVGGDHPDAVGGEATEFPLGGIFANGGSLLFGSQGGLARRLLPRAHLQR